MINQAKNVLNYYVLCNKLKNVIRTGWTDWHVDRNRLESVAEHIYGTQMLAIAMYSEYDYDIDICKVIFMLAIHELEETVIGDLTQFQISKEEKSKIGHEAIEKILSPLKYGESIKSIILEFDDRSSKEAKFAYFCDKLECDIQCKLYDEEGTVDAKASYNKANFHDANVERLLSEGKSWSEMWLSFGQMHYNYDEAFKEVSEYAKNNKISLS